MRYIGGKTNLLNDIGTAIMTFAPNTRTVIDIFSGSGAVSAYLKSNHYNIIGNDFMYFSYVLSRGTTALNHVPSFESLGNYISAANSGIKGAAISIENLLYFAEGIKSGKYVPSDFYNNFHNKEMIYRL